MNESMSSDNEQEEKINLMALGNNEVGKTSFILRYIENSFHNVYLTTVGIDFQIKFITLPNKKSYKIYFYDTAGQEKFKTLSFNVVKYSDGIILIYDITNKLTFDSIPEWIESINNIKDKDFPIILVGNKCDLENKREVPTEDGENLAKKYGISFFEVSNKTGNNIQECCQDLIDKIIKRKEQFQKTDSNSKLSRSIYKNKNKKCEC